MQPAVSIHDLRLLAQRKLPKIFFDYIDGGAFSETTMLRNRIDFAKWSLLGRVLRTNKLPDLSSNYLGRTYALPFMLGPVGFLGLYKGRGEMLAAESAQEKGIPLCLSTFSICSIGTLR